MEKEMLLTVIPSHPDLRYLGIQSECRYDVLCANKPSSLCILSQNLCRSFPHVTPGILAAAVGYSTCARFLLSYQLVTADCVFWGTSHYLFGYTNISIFFFFFQWINRILTLWKQKCIQKVECIIVLFLFVVSFVLLWILFIIVSVSLKKLGKKTPKAFLLYTTARPGSQLSKPSICDDTERYYMPNGCGEGELFQLLISDLAPSFWFPCCFVT